MSQTKPHPSAPPTRQVRWRVFSAGFPRGDPRSAEFTCRFDPPFRMAKIRGGGGVICGLIKLINRLIVFRPIQTEDGQWCAAPILFRQDCLSLTDEAGQASAYLYSEARLYKGARLAPLSQSTTTRSTGNISVGVKKVGHCNTRGTVISLFFPAQINCCTLVYIFNILLRLKVKVSRHLL